MRYLAFIIASVTMQSLTFGYVSSRYSYSENLQFIFMAFVLCSVFYYIRTITNNMKAINNDVKFLLFLNVYTAMAFVGFFISISLIPASLAGLVEASSGPLLVLPFSVFILKKKVRLNEVFIGVFFLFIALFVSFSAISEINKNVISGLLLAIMAGGGAALIAIYSRKTGIEGGQPEIVLAHRFHLTYIVSFALVAYHGVWNFEFSYLLISGLLAFAGIVLPLYFLQSGLAKSEPLQTMLCLAAIPHITYVFEWYFGREFDITVFFLIGSAVGLSVIYIIFESRRKALKKSGVSGSV